MGKVYPDSLWKLFLSLLSRGNEGPKNGREATSSETLGYFEAMPLKIYPLQPSDKWRVGQCSQRGESKLDHNVEFM